MEMCVLGRKGVGLVGLIDADAMRNYWLENGENEYVYDANAMLDSIDAQPTIDAVPVVHGRWVHTDEAAAWFGKDECSECHYHHADRYDLSFFNYCPNCGAKMDGESDG